MTRAGGIEAEKAAHLKNEVHLLPTEWQVLQETLIPTMYTTRGFATQRTMSFRLRGGNDKSDFFCGQFQAPHLQAGPFWEKPSDESF
jgi:hypothetical protein